MTTAKKTGAVAAKKGQEGLTLAGRRAAFRKLEGTLKKVSGSITKFKEELEEIDMRAWRMYDKNHLSGEVYHFIHRVGEQMYYASDKDALEDKLDLLLRQHKPGKDESPILLSAALSAFILADVVNELEDKGGELELRQRAAAMVCDLVEFIRLNRRDGTLNDLHIGADVRAKLIGKMAFVAWGESLPRPQLVAPSRADAEVGAGA